MPKIDPPPHPKLPTSEWVLERAGIFKCVASSNAMCGILWKDPEGKLFYEMTHGAVGLATQANEIVKISRTRCVGTILGNKDHMAERIWNMYVSQRERTSATPIYLEKFEQITLE